MTPDADASLKAFAQSRTWAMLANLAALSNFFFPFSGLIVAIVVYAAREHDLPFVRENARNAINAEITIWILNAVFIVVYVVSFASLFASGFGQQRHIGAPQGLPAQFVFMFAIIFVLLGVNVLFAIVSAVAARKAYLGGVFRYPFAIPLVRAKVALG